MPNDNSENCPHCGVSLQGAEIPADIREHYGDTTHFSRMIGMEVFGQYDGVLYYRCPDCGGNWHRFPEGDYRHERAEPYVKGEK